MLPTLTRHELEAFYSGFKPQKGSRYSYDLPKQFATKLSQQKLA